MSTTTTITLPPGVKIGPGRATTGPNGSGINVPGTVFGLTLPDGTTTSVFISDDMLSNLPAVESAINAKVAALSAITGAGA